MAGGCLNVTYSPSRGVQDFRHRDAMHSTLILKAPQLLAISEQSFTELLKRRELGLELIAREMRRELRPGLREVLVGGGEDVHTAPPGVALNSNPWARVKVPVTLTRAR